VTALFEQKERVENTEEISESWKGYSVYDPVVWTHGIGITTIFRQVGFECCGITYVDVAEDARELEQAFADAFN
jgi:hypothetical protein